MNIAARTASWLPYDAEVEYVQNGNKTPFIDLGYHGGPTDRYVVKFKWGSRVVQQNIFGATQNNGVYSLNISCYIAGVGRVAFSANDGTAGSWISTGYVANTTDIYTIDIDFCNQTVKLYINDSLKYSTTISAVSKSTYYTIMLFAMNRDGESGSVTQESKCINASLYSFAKYTNGVKVQDLIPVRKGSVGHLYDIVAKNLVPTIGGTLTAGPDVSAANGGGGITANG